MAGYIGYSKSNSAIEAENCGLMTATGLAKKLKVSSHILKQELSPKEWHHTSCKFNETDYYYEPALLKAAGFDVEDDIDADDLSEAGELLERLGKLSTKSKVIVDYENCTVKWLDWSTCDRRHRKPEECMAEDCTVIIKGATATIILPDGSKFQKRKGTNGFEVYQKQTCPVCNHLYRVKIIPYAESGCWMTEACIKYFRDESGKE